jgi:hypothetical protein
MVPTIFNGVLKLLMYMFQIVTGLPLLLMGISMHYLCGMTEFADGWFHGIQLTWTLTICSMSAFIKFFSGQCTIYYILDIIFGTLYKLIIELPIVLMKAVLGIDLQFIADIIHDVIIIPLDTLVFGLSGFHITKWPDSVVSKCYKCKGQMDGQILELTYYQWIQMYQCSTSEIIHGAYKMMYSLFPIDKHWGTWAKGRHLDGGDDATD